MTRRTANRILLAAVLLPTWGTHADAEQTHLLIVTGLGGDEAYTEQFHAWAATLVTAAAERYALPPENITYLGEDPALDPTLISARSTRENIESAIRILARTAAPDDHVVIVLFGHGSFTNAARINLPRRDLTAADFGRLLDLFPSQPVTFINAASASGPFVGALSGPGRTIMTATKTGRERNAARFGGYFVEAFAEGEAEADQNKDERISMLEAFRFARARVVQAYEKEGLLATEHAILDDNGDGEGSESPEPLAGDGMVARTRFLTSGAASQAEAGDAEDAELRLLLAEQQALEAQVEELQRRRGAMEPEEYQAEFERLMIALAEASSAVRAFETEAERVPAR